MDESTAEGFLEEGISTGNSAYWPGISRNGQWTTSSGAPAPAGLDGWDTCVADPDAPILIPLHPGGLATEPAGDLSLDDFLQEIGKSS